MTRVSVMYPSGEDNTFDMEYYLAKHCPLVREVFGDALKAITVEKGLSGPLPGSTPPYSTICLLDFEDVETFMGIMVQRGSRLFDDIPNYTNVSPTIQIGEVLSGY